MREQDWGLNVGYGLGEEWPPVINKDEGVLYVGSGTVDIVGP